MADIENMTEVDTAFREFSSASYKKYGNYNQAAGMYESLLSGLILGFHDKEYVLYRIKSETEALQK